MLNGTGENKLTIRDAGIAELVAKLEREWLGSKNFEKHQAGFCSQWLLDNTCKYNYVPCSLDKNFVLICMNAFSENLKV